jgi:hypothetical protein
VLPEGFSASSRRGTPSSRPPAGASARSSRPRTALPTTSTRCWRCTDVLARGRSRAHGAPVVLMVEATWRPPGATSSAPGSSAPAPRGPPDRRAGDHLPPLSGWRRPSARRPRTGGSSWSWKQPQPREPPIGGLGAATAGRTVAGARWGSRCQARWSPARCRRGPPGRRGRGAPGRRLPAPPAGARDGRLPAGPGTPAGRRRRPPPGP